MPDSRGHPSSRYERENWLRARGVPLPAAPVLPIAEDALSDARLRASDEAYLDAWDARDAEIDRLYLVARRDADGPPVPAARNSA